MRVLTRWDPGHRNYIISFLVTAENRKAVYFFGHCTTFSNSDRALIDSICRPRYFTKLVPQYLADEVPSSLILTADSLQMQMPGGPCSHGRPNAKWVLSFNSARSPSPIRVLCLVRSGPSSAPIQSGPQVASTFVVSVGGLIN